MTPGTLVLLHSPLLGAAAWGRLPDELDAHGIETVVVDVTDDVSPPYAATYIARAAQQIATAAPAQPLVLVAYSGSGPLIAQVGAAQRAARRSIGAYVFVDAGLPRAGASRLDLLRSEDAAFARQLEAHLAAGGRFPDWSDDDLGGALEDPSDREVVRAGMRPRGLDFFTETLPHPDDWPDAPCGYLRTSQPYASSARIAKARGWASAEYEAGHFAALAHPGEFAQHLMDLVVRL